MSVQKNRRKRQLLKKGRYVILSRPSQDLSIKILSYAAPPMNTALSEGLSKHRLIFQTMNDEIYEISKSTNFNRPRKGDRLQDNTRFYTLSDAIAIYENESLIGWSLIVEGGE